MASTSVPAGDHFHYGNRRHGSTVAYTGVPGCLLPQFPPLAHAVGGSGLYTGQDTLRKNTKGKENDKIILLTMICYIFLQVVRGVEGIE